MPNILLFADDALRLVAVIRNHNAFQDPDDDLSSYGPGKSFVKSEHRMRRNGFANDWSALRSPNYAFLGGVSQVAFSAAHVKRGEVLPTIAGTSVGIASWPILSTVINPTVRFLLPFSAGAAGTAALSSMLAILPAYGLGRAATESVRYFKSWGYKLRHIEQGGSYEDTETAYGLRLRSVSDMSSAMSYSRRWLGNEALFMR